MSSDVVRPDYQLADLRVVSSHQQLRAMADPLRGTVLELLLERAASVAELAAALGRPKSTVAHHVGVLVDAGLLRVVRTRRVRAVEERYYGRTARIFYVGAVTPAEAGSTPRWTSALNLAATESAAADQADELRAIIRHARIADEHAEQFWQRVFALVGEFMQLPRSGSTVFGFVAGLYPTEHPSLPEPDAR